MKRIRISLLALILAAAISGCDAGGITSTLDCSDPTMGSGNRC
jgi:hypothetical protein